MTPTGFRLAFLSFVLAGVAALAPGVADADPIAGSQSQVGAWRIGAYTRGRTAVFDHCSLYRLQADGFGVALGFTSQGIWSLGAEASDWDLKPNESYTAAVLVGAAPFTATGRAISTRAMTLNVAPEIFGQLKSGVQLSVSANQRRYTMGLDGVEAAVQHAKDCARQYAAQPAVPPDSRASPPSAAPSALVASIQNLLARLGYDPGPATGIVGLKTNIAISAFQKSQGERGDGLPSEAVRAQLQRVAAERGAIGGAQPPLPSSSQASSQSSSPPPGPPKAIAPVSSGTASSSRPTRSSATST